MKFVLDEMNEKKNETIYIIIIIMIVAIRNNIAINLTENIVEKQGLINYLKRIMACLLCTLDTEHHNNNVAGRCCAVDGTYMYYYLFSLCMCFDHRQTKKAIGRCVCVHVCICMNVF